jgi:hypothetical protein
MFLFLTIHCKLINFVFQIFPLFIPEMSAQIAQLYPQALGSLFVAYNDWQGYGGGILICHHTRL